MVAVQGAGDTNCKGDFGGSVVAQGTIEKLDKDDNGDLGGKSSLVVVQGTGDTNFKGDSGCSVVA